MSRLLSEALVRDPEGTIGKRLFVIAYESTPATKFVLKSTGATVTQQNALGMQLDMHARNNDCLKLAEHGSSSALMNWDLDDISGDMRAVKLGSSAVHCKKAVYLPYLPRRITHVTIETGWEANLFITDLLSGCTIYVSGTEQKPTIFHANAR